jgi:hypothetical protein
MNIDFSSYEVIVRRENERHTYGYINSIEIKKFCDYFNDIREKLCTQIYIYSLHELKSDKNLINCLHNFLRMKNIVCTVTANLRFSQVSAIMRTVHEYIISYKY